MPAMSDPLGAPQIVTGAQYMDSLARLGYNVENMTSPLPMISKIAEAGTNLLDTAYRNNLEYQQKQSDLAYKNAQVNNLDSVTDYNNQSLQNRLKALDLDTQKRANDLTIQSNTMDDLIAQEHQKTTHIQKLDGLQEDELSKKNDLTDITIGAAKRAQQEDQAAVDDLPKALADLNNIAPGDPDYDTKMLQWHKDHSAVAVGRSTKPVIDSQIAALEATRSHLSSVQTANTNAAKLNDLISTNDLPSSTDPDQLKKDPVLTHQTIARGNVTRSLRETNELLNSLPQGANLPPELQQQRRDLTNARDNLKTVLGAEDGMNQIISGAQSDYFDANGNLSAPLQGDINALKTYQAERAKQGLGKPTQTDVTVKDPVTGEEVKASNVPLDQVETIRSQLKAQPAPEAAPVPAPSGGQTQEDKQASADIQNLYHTDPEVKAAYQKAIRSGSKQDYSAVSNLVNRKLAAAKAARKPKGMQEGGIVPGVGNTDSVPASLTPGEYVVPKDVVQNVGIDTLEALTGQQAAAAAQVQKTEDVSAPLQPEKIGSPSAMTDPLTLKAPSPTNLLSLSGQPQAPRAQQAGAVGAAQQQAEQYSGTEKAVPVAPAAGAVGAAQQEAKGYQSLAQARSGYAAELADPETRRLLMASTDAEVGGQGPEAQQAYMESVINRAAAKNTSLRSVLLDPHYYPTETKNKLGAQMSQAKIAQYNPLIQQVLNGSNVSNLGTGNESGPKRIGTPPPPIVYSAGGERFVAESGTEDWRQSLLATLE
jgi:hypothetical protein